MKYQQFKNIECKWKWNYLVKKHQNGDKITKYIDTDNIHQAIEQLLQLNNTPSKISNWIQQHISPDLLKRLDQTIRARRKRYFNAKYPYLCKKSITLDFIIWQKLSFLAKKQNCTLSNTISNLIKDSENKKIYINQILTLKQDLQNILDK